MVDTKIPDLDWLGKSRITYHHTVDLLVVAYSGFSTTIKELMYDYN